MVEATVVFIRGIFWCYVQLLYYGYDYDIHDSIGGSVLVPLHYVPSSQSGLVFLPSFGMGAMLMAPLVCFVNFTYNKEVPDFRFMETFPVGLLSGKLYLMWCIVKFAHTVLLLLI